MPFGSAGATFRQRLSVAVNFAYAAARRVGATRDDVDAYHRERRRDDADHRINAASWNRAVASLERLYRS
jgi:hypothetical protein